MTAVIALLAGTLALMDARPVQADVDAPKAVYIAGTGGPPNADRPAVELVEELGFDVVVLDDDTPDLGAITASFTPAVIIVSSSIVPAKVGDMFNETTTPVVTWEPYLFDDLGLTLPGGGQRGEDAAGTAIGILDSTHPITAPLSGSVAVTTAARPLSYGVPAGEVVALASVGGSSSRAGILAAETGDLLAGGQPSPGARVGLFMSWSSPPVLTDDGRALVGKAISWAADFVPPAPNIAPVVDAGPDQTIMLPTDTAVLDATVTDDSVQLPSPTITWTGPAGVVFADASAVDTTATFPAAGSYVLTITADDGEFQTSDEVQVTVQDPAAPVGTNVIFVVGSAASPASNDITMEAALIAAGLDVTRVDDDNVPVDLTGVDGVVISTSVQVGTIGTSFTDVDIPILTWEGYLLDELGLSAGPNGESPSARTTINIVDPAHPLAAGLSGYTSVLTSSRRMTFATPGPGAEVVAFDGSPNANRAVLFAYLTDSPLPGGGTAPARRVVVFPNYGGTGLLTDFGRAIVDAAIAFFLVPDNEPPTVEDQAFEIDENSPNGTVVGQIAFSDPDLPSGDIVTFAVDGGTGTTAFDVSAGGEITVADVGQLDFETTANFTLDVIATDSADETDAATVTIAVNDVNDPPDAVADGYGISSSTIGGTANSLVGNDSDPDGDAVTIVAASAGPLDTASAVTSAGGRQAMITISDTAPQYRIEFGTNFRDLGVGENDTVTVTYTISDPGGLTDTANVLVTVIGANDPPVAVDDGFDVGESGVLTGDLLANDTDPDTNDVLEITGANGNAVDNPFDVASTGGRTGEVVVSASGALNFAFTTDGGFEDLAANETDTVTIDYDISDGNGGTDTATVTVTVNGENDPPTAVDDDLITDESTPLSDDLRTNDSDPDGDVLTVSAISHDGGAGNVSGTPFNVMSTGGRTAVVTATGTSFVLDPGGNFDGLALGESDTVQLTYTISDGNGGTDNADVTVTIDGTNNPPTAADLGVTAIGNTPLRAGTGETGPVNPPAKIVTNNLVTASVNAVSATPATGQATTQGGSVDINADGSFVYTPPTGFKGDDTFTYTVVSGDGLSDSGTVTVNVSDLVWYVSPTGGAGNSGRSNDPFGPAEVDRAGSDDIVYFSANGSTYNTGGDNPKAGQSWVGAGSALTVGSTTLVPAGVAPTVNQLSVNVADVTLKGMTVAGIAGTGASSLLMDDIDVTGIFTLGASTGVSLQVRSFRAPGSGSLSFTNVAGTSDFGSVTGVSIVLNTVTGSFAVNGSGSDTSCGGTTAGSCSGGTVGSVSITGSTNVELNKLKVLNSPGDAVTVTNSNGIAIKDSEIIGAGDANEEHGVRVSGHSGSLTVQDSLITGFRDTGVQVDQSSGTATITVQGSTIEDNHEIANGGDGEHGVEVRATGTANVTANVTGNRFLDIEGSAVSIVNESQSATLDTNINSNYIFGLGGADDFPTNPGINLIQDNLGTLAFDIQSNLIQSIPGDGISVSGDGSITGRIGGPAAVDGNVVSGDSSSLGDGVHLDFEGESPSASFTATVLVQHNTLQGLDDDGIQILHRDHLGTLHLTIEDNTITNVGSEGIRFFADNDIGGVSANPQSNLRIVDNSFFNNAPTGEEVISVSSGDSAATCAHISGNTGFDGAPANEIALELSQGATTQITQASLAALIAANPGSAATVDAGVTFNGGCTNPPLPSNP